MYFSFIIFPITHFSNPEYAIIDHAHNCKSGSHFRTEFNYMWEQDGISEWMFKCGVSFSWKIKTIKINSAVNLFYYQPLTILLTFLENFTAGLGWARSVDTRKTSDTVQGHWSGTAQLYNLTIDLSMLINDSSFP